MTARLRRDEVAHHLAALQKTLTALQSARLAAILDTLGDDGRFLLRAALDAAEFPAGDARGQDAFQEFRKRVNQAAAEAGVDLRLELDSRKVAPDQRHGWFTGGDLIDEGIASFTGQAAGRTGIEYPVEPEVAELGHSRRTRVYVSVPRTDDKALARKVGMLLRQLREGLALDTERSWEGRFRLGRVGRESRRSTRPALCPGRRPAGTGEPRVPRSCRAGATSDAGLARQGRRVHAERPAGRPARPRSTAAARRPAPDGALGRADAHRPASALRRPRGG